MDKVAEVLDKIAAKLGTAVEHLWPILVADFVRQAKVYVFVGIALMLLGLIGIPIFVKLASKAESLDNEVLFFH